MKKVLVPLAPGFEEIEAVTIMDVLRRAGVAVTVAGTITGPIQGSHGIVVLPDTILEQVDASGYDMIALPGGGEGVRNLGANAYITSLLNEFSGRGKWVTAICAAPSLLASAGLLTGKQATSYPSVQNQIAAVAQLSQERVVIDGKIVTSQGPGTSMEFALKLVEILVGPEKAAELKQGMIVL